jgi:hypothetical protein
MFFEPIALTHESKQSTGTLMLYYICFAYLFIYTLTPIEEMKSNFYSFRSFQGSQSPWEIWHLCEGLFINVILHKMKTLG